MRSVEDCPLIAGLVAFHYYRSTPGKDASVRMSDSTTTIRLELNQIHQGDCVTRMAELGTESIDLVFADPPFNIGYDYDEYDDRRSSNDYLSWSRQWISEVHRVLKSSGTFWLAIGDEYAAELKVLTQEIGFTTRSWVIWYYTFGVNCKRVFSRSHTHLFYFLKDPKNFTFNLVNPAVRVPSARQLVYGDNRANSDGRLPDNTWILRPQDIPGGFPAQHDTWYFPRVAGTFKERERFHGCQMPEQLLGRIVRSSSNPGNIVFDPFAGSGTSLVVAKKLGRTPLGIELSKEYIKHIRSRLGETHSGDPLDGAEDPLSTAPSTSQGRQLGLRSKKMDSKRHSNRANRQQEVRKEVDEHVIAAFAESVAPHSVDYALAHPKINAAFVTACQDRDTPGTPTLWNQSMLRLRKRGQLPVSGKKGIHHLNSSEMDVFRHASEIAMHRLSIDFDMTIESIFCNPELATAFDFEAARFTSAEGSSFQFRWAALAIRNRTRVVRRLARAHVQWLVNDLPEACPIRSERPKLLPVSAVYVVNGQGGVCLYVGETLNINGRIDELHQLDAWQELRPRSVHVICEQGKALFGVKSVLIQRLNPILNSRQFIPKA